MHKSDEESYLGDQVSAAANNVKTLSRRRAKGYGIISNIMYVIEAIPNGTKKTKVGLELRQAWFLNSVLLNMETWHNLQEKDLKELKKLDQYLLRKIIGAHSKVPIEFLFLETGALPIDFILKSRRINYLHTILNRNKNELTHKIYQAQKKDPTKGDWATKVEEDINEIKLSIKIEEIVGIKKSIFKNLVKKDVKAAAFENLKETQSTHIKINTIKYIKLQLQPYLDSSSLTIEQRSLIFNIRANTVNGFKMCFTSIYRNNLNCKLGCNTPDTIDHCMTCEKLDIHMGKTHVEISDIFSDTAHVQKEAIQIFMARRSTREAITDGTMAYQGLIVLDTSTPASVGGAGARRGLVHYTSSTLSE